MSSPTATTPPNQAILRPKPDLTASRKPTSPIAIFFWRWRMWFETTFVLSMLEPWEKILLLTVFSTLGFFVLTGIWKYMPHHLTVMRKRAAYYLWGQDGERLLWQWIAWLMNAVKSAMASTPHKEL